MEFKYNELAILLRVLEPSKMAQLMSSWFFWKRWCEITSDNYNQTIIHCVSVPVPTTCWAQAQNSSVSTLYFQLESSWLSLPSNKSHLDKWVFQKNGSLAVCGAGLGPEFGQSKFSHCSCEATNILQLVLRKWNRKARKAQSSSLLVYFLWRVASFGQNVSLNRNSLPFFFYCMFYVSIWSW